MKIKIGLKNICEICHRPAAGEWLATAVPASVPLFGSWMSFQGPSPIIPSR